MKLQIGVDGKTYEVEIEIVEDDEAPRLPNFGPYMAVPSTVQSTKAPVATAQPSVPEENVDEDKVSRSPVAGVVNKVNAQPGQQIQADDLLMVLEAMKMETNVTAAHAGTVKKVRVAQGDAVKVNQILVEFE